jgi:prefoldin beta subunit
MAEECNDPAHNHANPLANLDQETQAKIQELQMMEQSFQQLLMQKNAFSMEGNETDLIIKEVEKTTGEVSRIFGNQVVIKTTKEEILEDMQNKKKLIDTRMKSIDEQEKEFSTKIETIREEVMKKIQG